MVAFVRGREPDGALLGLPTRGPRLRRFNPVVCRVTDQVDERIANLFDERFVQLGLGAVNIQLDSLLELAREVAHDARKLVEHAPDLDHPRVHDCGLQLGGDEVDLSAGLRQLMVNLFLTAANIEFGYKLRQPVATQHEFSHEIEQVVETVDIHADRLAGGVGAADRPAGFWRGCFFRRFRAARLNRLRFFSFRFVRLGWWLRCILSRELSEHRFELVLL